MSKSFIERFFHLFGDGVGFQGGEVLSNGNGEMVNWG